jgi:DNA-binding transcriptional MerR regulator
MFRIGDFSKIAQVSGRLLRYYEEIGLLSPEFTDPQTGYRYYSAQQLPRLNRILVLKELGLSLEQIARLLDDHTSPDEIRGMLTLRKAQIEQSVQEEMERLRGVEARLNQLDVLQQPDVVLKSAPAQHFLAIREVLPDMEAVKRRVRSIATTIPTIVGQPNLSHIAVLAHSPIYEPAALDVEIGYLLTGKTPDSARLSEEYTLTRRELPAIETLATLIHVGRINDGHQTYGALGTWMEQNRWQISGTGREILVQLPQRDEEDEAVIELQYPVSRSPQE